MEADPSNETGDPATGETGLNVKDAVGKALEAPTVNEAELIATPAGVETLSGPVVAPAGTTVWIAVDEAMVKVALTPLKRIAVAPLKLLPLIATLAPAWPPDGVKLEIVGALTP